MALLALRFGPLLPAPPHHRRVLRNRCRVRIVASNAPTPVRDGGAAAVVWFKHDLRIDDHPGLAAAVSEPRRPVVPLYVFDRRILAGNVGCVGARRPIRLSVGGYSDKMLELLLFALKDLKMTLKSQDSDLLIGLGNAEDVVLKLVNEVQAGLVFTEEEVEYRVRDVLANVESSLSNGSFSWGSPPKIVAWSAPLYDYKNLGAVPTSHDDFLKKKLPLATPLAAATLPALNLELDTGSLPTLEELKCFLKEITPEDNWAPLKRMPARSILKRTISQRKIKSNATLSTINEENIDDAATMDSVASGKRIINSKFASENSLEVSGGTEITLDALAAYLKYLEGTGNASWQELHDKVRLAETRYGASFYILFGPAIQLGVISRRKAYTETIQYEKDRNAGFLSPFGYSTPTVTSAVDAICSMEYTFLGNEGPPVLLVHGFGAFLEHFRDNIDKIAATGHRVWAITLVGFGKSEKPNVNYSELFWSELLRDFIVEIVREPVHLLGNSIGGYLCAIAAGLWPSLAKSLVLLNSAGSVVPNYSFIPLSEERRTSWISRLQAQLLLLFLRSRAEGILKEYYPTRTERVDKPLLDQIVRASYDPGAAKVLESVFNFNLSIPLNFLFDSFGGKILVIQGMKDPLTKSEAFVTMLREHCSKVQIRELNAGHAPHDEVPDEVNTILCKWVEQIEVKPALEKTKAI
ncbi:Pheophytinase, chloroplastic [Zea mays]|uniref:Pheophytinase, chloroplastic n=2 Tax=Zea mays TaxID=4577 RepID=A0A3L6E2B6_MAIZE|nr:hypothetical protein Zm00014a_002544 [Zea mays]PWZ14617.1 hypothetical protein Zm00014a_002544 [Zea mays]PWZ14618.1 Pheophytinase, chloroplastic [Zea mays]